MLIHWNSLFYSTPVAHYFLSIAVRKQSRDLCHTRYIAYFHFMFQRDLFHQFKVYLFMPFNILNNKYQSHKIIVSNINGKKAH